MLCLTNDAPAADGIIAGTRRCRTVSTANDGEVLFQ